MDGKILERGFDRSFDLKNHGNYFSSTGNSLNEQPAPGRVDEPGYYAPTAAADHAIDCVKDHAAHHGDRPFFHYLAFTAPHFPLHASPEDIAKYRERYLAGLDVLRAARFERMQSLGLTLTTRSPWEREVGPPYSFPEALKRFGPGEIDRPLPWTKRTDEQRRFQATKVAIHAAMVDREIGRIVKQMREMQAFENTLIFFASDNCASAEIMVRDGGRDPAAAPGSPATHLCLGPGFSSACNTPHRRHKT